MLKKQCCRSRDTVAAKLHTKFYSSSMQGLQTWIRSIQTWSNICHSRWIMYLRSRSLADKPLHKAVAGNAQVKIPGALNQLHLAPRAPCRITVLATEMPNRTWKDAAVLVSPQKASYSGLRVGTKSSQCKLQRRLLGRPSSYFKT